MFSSDYFPTEYFNEYFKVTGVVSTRPSGGGSVDVNLRELKRFQLNEDDETILEFVVAFVLSQGSK